MSIYEFHIKPTAGCVDYKCVCFCFEKPTSVCLYIGSCFIKAVLNIFLYFSTKQAKEKRPLNCNIHASFVYSVHM